MNIIKRIILASKSPRRKELLSRVYPEFDIESLEVDESLPIDVHPREGVEILAVRKGEAVAKLHDRECLVISSDTLVELDGAALGKPRDISDAAAMLKKLSSNTHNVHTGVAVHYNGRVLSGVATSTVHFKKLSDSEIEEYVAGGEPMDKAGAYGIQGEGGKFVCGYDGDFDTIMGLSIKLTKRLIEEITGGKDD